MTINFIEEANQCVWLDMDFVTESPEDIFESMFWRNSGLLIGQAQGRGTTWFVQMTRGQAALRHYRRGGLLGKLVSDHYLFTGWQATRCYQEFQLLSTLYQAGVNVPRPIAARAVKRTFCYQADLLSEKIPNARDLVAILKEKPLSTEMYQKIGQEIKKMHDAQVNHTDLNIHNILIDVDNKVWIIDFDKCAERTGDHWKAGNLQRLKRSFIKEQDRANIHWQLNEFKVIEQAYR
jgi:3-deoxy-D-manno-octulosonic acid kinase